MVLVAIDLFSSAAFKNLYPQLLEDQELSFASGLD